MLKELKVKVNVSKGSVLTGNAWIDVLFGGEKVVEHAEVTAVFRPIDEVKTNTIEFTIEQFADPDFLACPAFYRDGRTWENYIQKATDEEKQKLKQQILLLDHKLCKHL